MSDLDRLSFSLNAALRVTRIEERSESGRRPLPFTTEPAPHDPPSASLAPEGKGQGEGQHSEPEPGIQVVTVSLRTPSARDQILTLEWSYEGMLNDPPREPRQLRFVTPSETAGHIGSEGVYLSGETHWYPHVQGALPTAKIVAATPEGWDAVTHGRQVSRSVRDGVTVSEWQVSAKTEALTLVANRFVKTARDWRDPSGRSIEVAAYLFPEDAHLAEEYVQASVRYLEFYTKLLGPYPFPKFAVVENFFASGLGMPSFTLLGNGIIKRHYVQPYALGHEIVHSWIGNWVFNDFEQGNWVEGLTTYLANYYYEEATGTPAQAREQRRMLVLGYAVYVSPQDDYAVGKFRTKSDQRDNAIGYQKAAMVFHMLRRQLGDQTFWAGIRTLATEHGGSYATWKDLVQIFGGAAGMDLGWFFAQWIDRAGAPTLKIAQTSLKDSNEAGAAGRPEGSLYHVAVRIVQEGQVYRIRLPISLELTAGLVHAQTVEVTLADQTFTLSVPARPVTLKVDPDFQAFRSLPREHLPPMLNLYVTDQERTLVIPTAGSEAERAPYTELVTRLATHQDKRASGARARPVQVADGEFSGTDSSVLILGGPGVNRAADWSVRACGGRVSLERNRFTVEGRTYDGPDAALLISCRHPNRPGHVVTLFYGLTPSAAAKVSRLLFFYGWQSYLVFRDGAVVARGDFVSPQEVPEARFQAGDR